MKPMPALTAHDDVAEKLLLEEEEAQWTALFNSPESEIWLEQMGVVALLELNAGLTELLTEGSL